MRYYTTESFEQHKLVLFHYPILDWQGMYHGSIHVHGHIHSKGSDYNITNFANGTFAYDCGVDANDYHPVALESIIELADAYLQDHPQAFSRPTRHVATR